jgi:SWI/SNF-related matrix-associated actin-dependent regulator of chromatin subfamily A-like protein 1
VFGTWTAFANRYCNPHRRNIGGRYVMDYTGSSNERELHTKLKNVMVRRLKMNVLDELPPKQRSIVPVPISSDQKAACAHAMADLKETRESVAMLFGREAQQADFEAKSKLMTAYQASGIGKAKSVAEYLLDWLSGSANQKILVFAHHKAVLDTIDQALMEKHPNSHIRIDGSVPTVLRAQLVKKFQTCERVRVGLLSMTAAGVGLTLTAASTVLFAELHWTPGVLAQCEDRAHRIGQTGTSVQILYAVCKDDKYSVDMTVWRMLGRKIGAVDAVVDGKEVSG